MGFKIIYFKVFVALSIGMIAFSLWAGSAAKDASQAAMKAAEEARSKFAPDDAYQPMYDAGKNALEETRAGGIDRIHFYVKALSVPYFLFFAVIFGINSIRGGGGGWFAWLLVSAAVMMIAWSLLLSHSVDFSEVYFAWVAAAVFFGAFSTWVVLLYNKKTIEEGE